MQAQVILRTFWIRCAGEGGTAVAIDVSGRQYLVTAKHVLEPNADNPSVEIHLNDQWQPLHATVVGHDPQGADVSVLASDRELAPANLPLEPTMKGMVYGQDCYFLGFPFGLNGGPIGPSGMPIPMIKRATVSLIYSRALLLDGLNNKGFSGGPVAFKPQDSNSMRLAGIVANYQAVDEPIYVNGETTESSLTVKHNTGIIVAYSIHVALEIIERNPIGFEL